MLQVNGTSVKMTRGDTAEINIQLKDETGTQINLVTGDTIYFTVKTSPHSTVKTLQKVITTFDAGIATIELAPADTADLSYGKYVYDIQYNRLDGFVRTVVPPSSFIIAEEVTYE